MDQQQFESSARADGFVLRQGEIKPDSLSKAHTHPWDARLFILSGALTLVREDRRETFRVGEICDVPAGTSHQEATGAEGVTYIAARRELTGGAEAI